MLSPEKTYSWRRLSPLRPTAPGRVDAPVPGARLIGAGPCRLPTPWVSTGCRPCRCRPTAPSSRPQNTDAALLPCISYPAFALDDEALFSQTLDKVVRKLKGKYGFKRFLRDGYRTSLEDPHRRYYKPAEIKVPENATPGAGGSEVLPGLASGSATTRGRDKEPPHTSSAPLCGGGS